MWGWSVGFTPATAKFLKLQNYLQIMINLKFRMLYCNKFVVFAGKKSNSSRTIIIIVVAAVVFVVLIICVCIYLRMKTRRKKVESKLKKLVLVLFIKDFIYIKYKNKY
jgi:threonine/homoserine/homoserine lactone efflux protein